MMDSQPLTHKKMEGDSNTETKRFLWVPTLAAIISIIIAALSLGSSIITRINVNQLESRVIELESALLEQNVIYQQEDQDVMRSRGKRSLKERRDGVPVYDRAYLGLNSEIKHRLKLYESLHGDIPNSMETRQPHHLTSATWSSEQTNSVMSPAREDDDGDDELLEIAIFGGKKTGKHLLKSSDTRRNNLLNRRSRVMKMHDRNGSGRRRRQRPRSKSNITESVLFRPSHVQSTNRASATYPSPPPPPPMIVHNKTVRVDQNPENYIKMNRLPLASMDKKKKKSNRQNRRFKKSRRNTITAAHFHATNTSNFGLSSTMAWTPASWMEGLGLNRKYHLAPNGGVVVKEPGLYLIYAQLEYDGGLSVETFNVLQDNIPFIHCKVPAPVATLGARVHSCHTSGTTYLPRNAVVRIDNNPGNSGGSIKRNSFFGLIKLMTAPETAEELLVAN